MTKPSSDAKRLARLQDHFARFGVLPSYAGICELVGFRSKASSAKLVARLRENGYLRLAPSGRVAPDERFFERPLLGRVRAGAPDLPQDTGHEVVTLDRFLIERPSETVLVRVRGESMRDAGILHGDLVVVERQSQARPGDFVIALVDGELTLKEYDLEGKRPILRPHNPEFEPIIAGFDLEILGVVTGVVRKIARHRRGGRDSAA
ncbi:MAG: transcriptional repressor LexA [Burkholderiaceae bacterium]|jgi:repressor LexA